MEEVARRGRPPVAAQEVREMPSMEVAGAGLPTEITHEREEQTPV